MTISSPCHLKLHWTCQSPTHYNDSLFSAVAAAGIADLLVHYRNNVLTSHPWKTQLRSGYGSRVQGGVLGLDWHLLREAFSANGRVFVLGGWSDSTTILLVFLCAIRGVPFYFWTDTPNLQAKRGFLFKSLRSVFLRIAFSLSTAVLSTGTPALRALSRMGVPENKIVNFPYWINVSDFCRKKVFGESTVVRIVSSGRLLNSLKGHDIAIESLAEIHKRSPRFKFEYFIAGTGPDADALAALAESLGIGPMVKLLGWLEPWDLTKLLCGSDMLIHPSPVHEPYGVAVIEAMAAGLVVFASDTTCAALDRIENGLNGFIHRAGNREQLAEQISGVMDHPEQVAAIQAAARKTAEEWPLSRAVNILRGLISAAA